ncbi:chaplin [Streptomyces sp. NPDC058067]|uniref:Chaplin n=1 Tax=Streptomyces antnestii TaxID=2494256 RepID=A0A3S2XXU8_9ACTN|nr:chaplin [Streptomyces sp. San01]RVU27880.1 chaplin [Streptomyces sp. San01]
MRIRTFIAATALGAAAILAGAGAASADSDADGYAVGSPGIISGNNIQVPIDLDANVCGNTINVIGLLNPAAANFCANK